MSKKAEEYLKRLAAWGYDPSLDGMDDKDIPDRPWQSSQNNQSEPSYNEFRPVDRDFAERIFKMFARPFDPNWRLPNLDGPEYSQPPKAGILPKPEDHGSWRPDLQIRRDGGCFGNNQADAGGGRWRTAPGYGLGSDDATEVRPMSGGATGGQEVLGGELKSSYEGPKPPDINLQDTFPDEMKPPKASGDNSQSQGTSASSNLSVGNPGIKPGDLSAQGESGNNPGEISPVNGDLGGKSYGLYQFSRDKGVADSFVKWLADNDKDFAAELGQWPVGSEQFDKTWQKIAKENPARFAALQTEYTRGEYYDKAADLLREDLGFDISRRSPALQSVLWSRSVHYAPRYMPELFAKAAAMAGEPLSTISDEKLIHNIYEFLVREADNAHYVGNGMYHSPEDWVNGSEDVVEGLRARFLREREQAQNLLRNSNYR